MLRPTQVASILGLDLEATIKAQPLTDEMLAAAGNTEPLPSPERVKVPSGQKLRKVVM